MKILLLFPPQWWPTQPYLSLPCLTAYLRSNECEVVQRDINVEFYNLLLSSKVLKDYYDQVLEELNCLSRQSCLSRPDQMKAKRLLAISAFGSEAVRNIERAKEVFRSNACFDTTTFLYHSKMIGMALEMVSALYHPAILRFDDFMTNYSTDSSSQVLKAIRDDEQNLFIPFFRKYSLPNILTEAPDIVGISINGHTQVIPGLTLARLIKETNKDIHITVGGSIFSRLFDRLPDNPELFSIIDSIVLSQGEVPLLRLVQCLEEGSGLDRVPSLVYRDDSSVRHSKEDISLNPRSLPTPIFDGLPLNLYFTPEIVFPLQTSRGCYWGKCTFCDYIYESRHYRTKAVSQIVRDFTVLKEKYNAKYFHLVDSAPHPNLLERLSKRIVKDGIEVYWATMIRFERELESKEYCEQLYQSGCRMLEFGVESGSQRILHLLKKGTTKNSIRKIMWNCKKAGIANIAFVMIGLPSETSSDALETYSFLEELDEEVFCVMLNKFMLTKFSRFWKEPEKFGISAEEDNGVDDWMLSNINIKAARMSDKDLERIYCRIHELAKKKDIARSLRGGLWDGNFVLLHLVAQEKRRYH